jgi:hypothetical protein
VNGDYNWVRFGLKLESSWERDGQELGKRWAGGGLELAGLG